MAVTVRTVRTVRAGTAPGRWQLVELATGHGDHWIHERLVVREPTRDELPGFEVVHARLTRADGELTCMDRELRRLTTDPTAAWLAARTPARLLGVSVGASPYPLASLSAPVEASLYAVARDRELDALGLDEGVRSRLDAHEVGTGTTVTLPGLEGASPGQRGLLWVLGTLAVELSGSAGSPTAALHAEVPPALVADVEVAWRTGRWPMASDPDPDPG